jgi:phosphoglycolate phosphatase
MCSNKPTPLCRKIVDELHLSDFFDALVGGEPGCPPKPDPAPLRRALEAIGADPRSSLFVGDSTVDQKTAAACSVPFVFFSSGYDDGVNHGDAFRVISRLEEILELTR